MLITQSSSTRGQHRPDLTLLLRAFSILLLKVASYWVVISMPGWAAPMILGLLLWGQAYQHICKTMMTQSMLMAASCCVCVRLLPWFYALSIVVVALSIVAVHWCWVTAHLHEEHIFTDVIAVTQACCQPVVQSSTEQ